METSRLVVVFQASLDQGVILNDWKTANVFPVFKKGENRPENYQLVSLASVVCKLMEHIICSNIMRHTDVHSILIDAQCGVRKCHSWETQLLLIQDLEKNGEDKGQVDVILLLQGL